MKTFLIVVRTELYKLFHSNIYWIVGSLLLLIPIVSSIFMYALQHPHLAEQMGLLGQKAQMADEATWHAFFDVQSQMIAVGGIIAFNFITSWIFGREFVHGTIKDLLVLPFPRAIVVLGKFFCAFIASLLLVSIILTIGVVFGLTLQLAYISYESFYETIIQVVTISIYTISLCLPVAFFASFSRGYLAPFGYIICILIFSQLISAVGFGEFFPWAIPALYSGMSGTPLGYEWAHFFYIIGTSLLGVLCTTLYWTYADHDD